MKIVASWLLEPLKSIGPLALGMSRSDVDRFSDQLGSIYAYDKKTLPDGRVIYKESRDLEAPIITYENDLVIEIMIDHHSRFDIILGDVSIFHDPAQKVLAALEKQNGKAYWGFGAVVFPKLSIGTMNFLIEIEDDGKKTLWGDNLEQPPRSLTLAKEKAYEEFIPLHYTQISFL